MKKFFNLSLIALLAASMSLSSCNDDSNDNVEIDSNEPAYLSLSISMPKGMAQESMAVKTATATAGESAINSIDVLIYSQYGTFKSHNRFTEFTKNTDGTYTIPTAIQSTVGEKIILVGANLAESVITSVENKSLSEFIASEHTFARANIKVANGLPMFSKATTTTTLLKDVNNVVNVSIERMVAKITVEKATDMTNGITDGTLGDLQFALQNFNTVQHLLPHSDVAGVYSQDPNWALDDYAAGEFSAVASTDYVAVQEKQTDVTALTGIYATENTSEGKRKKEITYATVRATFIPKQIITYDATSEAYSLVDNAETSAKTFYLVVEPTHGQVYTYDNAVASALVNDFSGTMLTYTGGYCYWYLWLNKDSSQGSERWDIVRNNFQRCTINGITTIGRPKEVVDDQVELERTPEDDASIEVSINVLDWNTPIEDGYVLGN
ncbi:MAG: Mfa1 family fimbria major subunit [Mangrovibacterium sp.]